MDTVQKWMTSPAILASETMTLPDARRLMQKKHIRRLPVVDATGRLVGIVTEGDINRVSDSHITDVRDYNLYHRVADLPIEAIMSGTVVTVAPETPILALAQRLLEERIGGVPVVDEGQVVGVISESDLFRRIVAQETGSREPAARQELLGV